MPRKATKRSTKAKPEKKKKPGKGRYGSVKKTTYFGIKFDSKREAKRYLHLRALEIAGDIRDLQLQPRIAIVIGGVPVRYSTGKQMIYIGDFRYFDVNRDQWVLEDAKGHKTDVYRIKHALLHTMGETIEEV